ncbi:MAG: EAL domain-containing protein, partial [Oceanibaculum sp.]
RDIAQTRKVAPELKACGVTIAIDDFGAGFSSFASLRDLPFSELKVDSSFVKNCAIDANNAAICQTAIDLAHRFGSVAVAEGIETMADLQALVVMGCDFGQGMLVAPPMPKASAVETGGRTLASAPKCRRVRTVSRGVTSAVPSPAGRLRNGEMSSRIQKARPCVPATRSD